MPRNDALTAWIDDRPVDANGSRTILEAAESVGISIPTLCHDAALGVRGACRICVVEIDGQRELPPACHTLLRAGQVVHTRSQRVVTARRTLLELAIGGTKSGSDRAIPTRLDELVAEYGANPLRFSGAGKPRTLVQNDPLLVRDLVRCIRCDRCWRYCDANQAIGAIKPVGRGTEQLHRHVLRRTVDGDRLPALRRMRLRVSDRRDQRALALRTGQDRTPRPNLVPVLRNRMPDLRPRGGWPDRRRRTGRRQFLQQHGPVRKRTLRPSISSTIPTGSRRR